MIKFKRILFPTDFSVAASQALDYAISLALEHEATLCVLHVAEDLGFSSPFILSSFPRSVEFDQGHGTDQLKKRMRGVIAPQLKRQIKVEELVAVGKPYREILRVAKEKDVDLIVVPAQRDTTGRHHHLGSTAERVASAAHCPVLIIRYPEMSLLHPETSKISEGLPA